MGEELRLVSDLALILISASVVTVIFRLLKQPLVLGYIVAGFLVGPHLHIFPTVTDISDVQVWSEIGIIFLLFGSGLEFSLKKIFSVGSKAIVSVVVGVVFMVAVGIAVGLLMGWDLVSSAFLGGMLSMTSTAIIVKAFEDLNLKNQTFANLTMAVTIIHDIVAVIIMVLISTTAASKGADVGRDVVMSILKLFFFITLWFVVGIFLIPSFLRAAKKYINDETLLIISIGLCFGMVVIANSVGFSSALGAFVMGSILSETIESEHIVSLTKSIKDLFGAIFFVSVGMMVDPLILGQYWKLILSLVLVTLIFKPIASAFAALVAGASLEDSIKTGFALSQIGEFSFIIASVGVAQGVMPPFIYPVIIASSVITTFTTPYWIKISFPICNQLEKHLPVNVKEKLDSYSLLGTSKKKKDWWSIINASLPRVLIFSVLCIALIFFLFQFALPFIENIHFGETALVELLPSWLFNLLCTLFCLVLMSPMLYGLLYNNKKIFDMYVEMVRKNNANILVISVWTMFRFVIAGFFVFSVLMKFFSYTKWVVVLITFVIVLLIMFSARTMNQFNFLETRFKENLNAKNK